MEQPTCNAMESVDPIRELLEAKGITPTQQRMQIAQILFARPQHLSAEQLLEQVNRHGAVASKATIYNTLGLFTKKGLIKEVIIDRAKIFYDSNTEPHHHFYFENNGTLADVSVQEFTLDQNPEPPEGMEIDGVDIIVRLRNKN